MSRNGQGHITEKVKKKGEERRKVKSRKLGTHLG